MLLKPQSYLVIGATTVDIIARTDDIKKVNLTHRKDSEKLICIKFASKTSLKDIDLSFGGSAANSACALSKVKSKSTLVSCVGKDYFGSASISNLKKFGVSTRLIKKRRERTGIGVAIINADGEKSVLVFRGANNLLSKGDIAENDIKKADNIFITSLVSKENFMLFKKVLTLGRKNNKSLIFVPSITMLRAYKNEIKRLEKYFDICIMNFEEARYYTGIIDIKEVIKNMPGLVRVVTCDVNGAYAYDGDRILKIGIIPLKVVDSTGAGDAFSACFCNEFFRTKSVESALSFATLCASLKIAQYGARLNRSVTEIQLYYKRYKKYLKVKEIK